MIRKFMSYILPPPSSTSFSFSSICTLAFLFKEVQNCRSSLIHGNSLLPIGNVLKYFHVLNFTKSSFIVVLNFAFQANGNLHFRALDGNRASTTFRQLLLLLNYEYINLNEVCLYTYIQGGLRSAHSSWLCDAHSGWLCGTMGGAAHDSNGSIGKLRVQCCSAYSSLESTGHRVDFEAVTGTNQQKNTSKHKECNGDDIGVDDFFALDSQYWSRCTFILASIRFAMILTVFVWPCTERWTTSQCRIFN
jgi:hypothetical protein